MKPQALLMMLGVVAVLLATQTLAASQQRPKPIPWPCCDSCSACTRSIPPQCLCADTSPTGCHPRCKSCDKFTDDNGATLFECKDRIANFCQRRCTPAA